MTSDYHAPTQPDILEVIADLSNDEVRTPPSVANAVLDLLPTEVWTDSTLRWLDPGVKTGVFLREITKRLLVGLAAEIPDEKKRLEHILKNQVFGIAITELTALMGRRTLYCSKDASSERSIVKMDSHSGNLWFERTRHLFSGERCTVCGGQKAKFDSETSENYAYALIHEYGRIRYQEEYEMKFDIVVGNPPYQMEGGGGGRNASPLYNLFVEQALALGPKYLAFVIPSRWMAGGRGLDSFRQNLLNDTRVSKLVDFPEAEDVFPVIGKDIKGGVCYFLWDSKHDGPCQVTSYRKDSKSGPTTRMLGEFDVFVRENAAKEILKKVRSVDESSILALISGDTPFGLSSNFSGYRRSDDLRKDEILYFGIASGSRFTAAVKSSVILKNRNLLPDWKLFLPEGYGAGEGIPHQILGQPVVAGSNSCCSQSFLAFGPFENQLEANSAVSYVRTRFFRFMVSLRKISQHALRSTYTWVPMQTWDREWTDADLYKKYGITKDEQAYIESMIKEMPV